MKLKQIEAEHGNLENVIPALVNQHGQHRTAALLKVSPATINAWLKHNGYRAKITYVKESAA